jgi:L-alanine-DL-glutamate epimerase-like enolase superfamily enzyme
VKITSVRTVVVNAEMRNWVFVRVDTEEDGLYGWGEASLEWKTRAVCGQSTIWPPSSSAKARAGSSTSCSE